jgi:hypothetical protein
MMATVPRDTTICSFVATFYQADFIVPLVFRSPRAAPIEDLAAGDPGNADDERHAVSGMARRVRDSGKWTASKPGD